MKKEQEAKTDVRTILVATLYRLVVSAETLIHTKNYTGSDLEEIKKAISDAKRIINQDIAVGDPAEFSLCQTCA
jgi:hypothetical protein